MGRYSIENCGLCLFSSDSVVECFDYFKNSIESMPKGYKLCTLVINDDLHVPFSPAPLSVPVGNNEIHIHIHIGDK